MQKEIDKLMKMSISLEDQKKEWKDNYYLKNDEMLSTINRFEREISYYKTRDIPKFAAYCQTDIDINLMREYHSSYETLKNSKKLVLI